MIDPVGEADPSTVLRVRSRSACVRSSCRERPRISCEICALKAAWSSICFSCATFWSSILASSVSSILVMLVFPSSMAARTCRVAAEALEGVVVLLERASNPATDFVRLAGANHTGAVDVTDSQTSKEEKFPAI